MTNLERSRRRHRPDRDMKSPCQRHVYNTVSIGRQLLYHTMPRIYNTITQRRGTAWRATEGEPDSSDSDSDLPRRATAQPSAKGSCNGGRHSSVFSDPNFDFEDELLPKHQHKISIRRSSKRAGRTHRRPTRLPASKATVVSVPVPVSVAEKSSQGKEPSHSTLTLDAKIQETEKLLEQPQTASMAALREKNIEIKKMALELDEARQECDALKRRLNRVETVSSRVSDKIEGMEKELAG